MKIIKTGIITCVLLTFFIACGGTTEPSEKPIITVDAGVNQSVVENVTVQLRATTTQITQIIKPIQQYSWTQIAGQPVDINQSNEKNATFTAPLLATNETITLTFQINVVDTDGNNASDTVDVEINNINTAPSIEIADSIIIEHLSSITIQYQVTDPEGDNITVQIGNVGANLNVSQSDGSLVISLLNNTFIGVNTFTITASDGELSTSREVSVSVIAQLILIVNAGENQSVIENTVVHLEATVTDIIKPIEQYSWTQIAGQQVAINQSNEKNATFTAPLLATNETITLTFQINVVDTDGNNASDTVDIEVSQNDGNLIIIVNAGSDQSVIEDTVVHLEATVTDIIKPIEQYSWTQIAGQQVAINQSNEKNATFTAPLLATNETITLTFQINVVDTDGNNASDTVDIEVSNINTAPTIEINASITIEHQSSMTLQYQVVDPEGDNITIQIVNAGDKLDVQKSDSSLVISLLQNDFVGVETFTIIASDGELSASEDVSVTIIAQCLLGGEQAALKPNAALPEFDEGHPPHSDGLMLEEHLAATALVAYSEATHAAISSGAWCDPNVWHNGEVPTNNANVIIPVDITINYSENETTELKTLRVDGQLTFNPDRDTKITFDTFFVDPRGTLEIGTVESPIQKSTTLMIADNGDIDVAWDPMLLSRSVISHGKTRIHGLKKKTHLKVLVDPLINDDVLVLSDEPVGWNVGDTIIVTGTFHSAFMWDNAIGAVRYFESQDEERTIVQITGNNVKLDSPLLYDHKTPRSDLKASIANLTRNIIFTSENGEELPNHRRGHVMFMHNLDADVRYASFEHLGRTNKAVDSFDIENVVNVQSDSNVRGRYSLHMHRTGTSDQKNPSIIIGNSVYTSPGWGYVHHDSHAKLIENVSFNTFGAGFVAETGNETGAWIRNIAIKGKGREGLNPKNTSDIEAYDIARSGSGFWFQGRLVRAVDNIASSFNHGFVYLHRGTGLMKFDPALFMLPEALQFGREATVDDAPIRRFEGNESYANSVGLAIVKANPDQGHDVTTVLSDFTAWEVEIGAIIEYTSHYLVENFDLIGNTPEDFRHSDGGIEFGNNTSDMIIKGAKIENFEFGIDLSKHFTDPLKFGKDQYVVIETTFIDVNQEYLELDLQQDIIINNQDLNESAPSVSFIGEDGLEFNDPTTGAGTGITITGTKLDSIGTAPIPAGTDNFEITTREMIALVEMDGYYRDEDGAPFVIFESFFSDRASGEIYRKTDFITLGPDVDAAMQMNSGSWDDAIYNGVLTVGGGSPQATNDSLVTTKNSSLTYNIINNDSDPDGDNLRIDGIISPRNGDIFDNNDGTITYIPDYDFVGTDSFYYWVTDGKGNYTKAFIDVTVLAN